MTPNDQLTQLWELLGKGTHKAWPECVERMDDGAFLLYLPATNHEYYADFDDRILLDLVVALCEGWLVESTEGTWVKPLGTTKYILWIGSCDYDECLPIVCAKTH